MALLRVLVCSLLAAWRVCPGHGLPLVPVGRQGPAPAVGECWAPGPACTPAWEAPSAERAWASSGGLGR